MGLHLLGAGRVKGRGRSARGEGRKKGRSKGGARDAAAMAAQAARDAGGCLVPDPRRVKANKRTFFPLEETYDRDLFGKPVQPGRGRSGRPRHVPTPETRSRVAELRGEGLSHLAIARAIGISDPTLRLNYAVELGSGSTVWRRRAARLPGDRGGDDDANG